MYQYRLEKITKVFGRHQIAVDGFDLEVQRGERVALIGPSGGGKTTLFRMLNCTLRPSSGRLWIDGDEVVTLHGKKLREVRRRIGTIYQQHNLVPRLRVVHNVLSGNLGRWSTGLSLVSLVRPVDLQAAYNALRQVGIEEKVFHRTDELSGGQQQRVAIARVLIQNPEVILADEPVSSVDPSLAAVIVKLLLDISQDAHKTLLMNLHSVDLALAYFLRVIGIKKGRPLFDLPPDKVSEELLEELYSGRLPNNHEEKVPDGASRALVYQ
ncbi:MAG: phosphonate ABC transporter ATP-binding protein [Deltaproteobacteria bacterium]|nr:phosphonate ABC transporter ATP-binding protein [Deltaproteobacteria bacterium]